MLSQYCSRGRGMTAVEESGVGEDGEQVRRCCTGALLRLMRGLNLVPSATRAPKASLLLLLRICMIQVDSSLYSA